VPPRILPITEAPSRATFKDLRDHAPSYWLDQPAVVSVENFKFQPLWDACEKVARSYQFQLDREDYRLGLITTRPRSPSKSWSRGGRMPARLTM